MFLTDEEIKMLDGEMGYPVQKAMQIMVTLGESFGAEKMLPVSNVHMPGSGIVNAGLAGIKFVEEIQAKGGKFCTFTTTNTRAMDGSIWREIGLSQDEWELQNRLTAAYAKMGAVTCSSCTPYLIGNVPRLGEHIAWGESSAVVFANSVLGARTNREGGPSALAAALTGRVPGYGFHLKENRQAKLLINVSLPLNGTTDYGTLGYFVGAIAGQDTPVFTGIPTCVSLDQLKALSAALASTGAISMFHIVGVTPEAKTVEEALGGHQPKVSIEFTLKEKLHSEALLNKEKSNDVNWVVLGCPHASIQEFRDIALALAGKKVHREVTLWVCSSGPMKALAEHMGYAQTITEAGGILVCETCPVTAPTRNIVERVGYRTLATNSAKMAHYSPGQFGLPTHYGSLEQVIEAAINGVWR